MSPRYIPSPQEAHDAARVSMEAQGLEIDEFSESVAKRVIAGELTDDEAIALLVEHYDETP
jgi:hypothetical protein